MGISLGVLLLVGGLELSLDLVAYDISRVADVPLGLLFVVIGAATLVLGLVSHALRSRRARVEQHHHAHT